MFPIPRIRCPTASVPFRRRIPEGDWRTWEVADQRFVDHRPDVLSFVSEPLDHDLTVTGPLAADLFASTSGTDSDFIVKLIDVYPDRTRRKMHGIPKKDRSRGSMRNR